MKIGTRVKLTPDLTDLGIGVVLDVNERGHALVRWHNIPSAMWVYRHQLVPMPPLTLLEQAAAVYVQRELS